ncbi:MAG TPA: hypothetical protein VM657_09430 [Sphingomonas sp.]|nr:hypothetical protein [Sphingomonas sp.]
MSMRIFGRLLLAAIGATFFLSAPAHAQFDRLLDTLGDKAVDAITQQSEAQPASDAPQTKRPRLTLNQGFDFTPGTHVVTAIDFADAAVGAMPPAWKTNGSGQIVASPDLPGKWLALQAFATYKLATPPTLADRFTVEFDIVPVGDTLRDVGGVTFGFAADNSVQSYMQDAYNDGAINAVELNFAGDSSVASSATGISHFFKPALDGYINRPMHVSMAVDGDRMRVYIGREKIADAQLFDGNRARYLFISAPVRYDHGAQALIGNLRIATFE